MTPQRRNVIQERARLIEARVRNINQRLKSVSPYHVYFIPTATDMWRILPAERTFRNQGFPIIGNKFRLKIWEDVKIIPTAEVPEIGELIFISFIYVVKKIADPDAQDTIKTDLLPRNWEFRYEFTARDEEHQMPQAGEPSTLDSRLRDRLPPFHMHVYERGTVDDDLHYPIGTPENPFDLLFEIIRFIRDEFVP